MENAVMKEKLANNTVHNQQVEEQIKSLTESSTSMAALLGNSDEATSHILQDKTKKLAENFKNYSASPINARAPAPRSVRIEVPTRVALTNNTAASVSIPLPQVTPVQPGNQQAEAGEVGNISPSNLSNQMRAQEHMEVEPNTNSLPLNEQYPPHIE